MTVAADPRAYLHQLVDQRPEPELRGAARMLVYWHLAARPIGRALTRAAGDTPEELTPEEEAALDEGLADVAAGRVLIDDALWASVDDDATRCVDSDGSMSRHGPGFARRSSRWQQRSR